jgi:hypothetical protein
VSAIRALILVAVAPCAAFLPVRSACADALDRLTAERLEAVDRAIAELKTQRRELKRPGPFREYGANLHVHSAFSHDSRGKIEDIVAAAKAVGTQVLMFNEHPADHYDFFKDGHQGIRDGVLLVPGAETKGFLVFPTQSVRGLDAGTPQEFCDLVRGRDGLVFVSHLEERMDWTIRGVTGVEIYNTHADFKDEKRLISALRNPLWLFGSAELFRKHPQAAFSALHDYPADYLKRWDELCQTAPHTGVSANDAHQNVGLILRLAEGNKVLVEDALEKKLLELDAGENAALEPLLKGKQPGDVIFDLRIDRYEQSLRHVGTHLLMKELTREAVWEALESGRAFVAFDWLADATGFDFAAVAGADQFEMGSRMTFADRMRFRGQSPLPGTWKLIRNGTVVSETTGANFDVPVAGPGVFRVEVWLDVAGKRQIWILSNPIYVQADR